MNPADLLIFSTVQRFQESAAVLIAAAIRDAVKKNGTCRLMLTGGTTPAPIYRALTDPAVVGAVPFGSVHVLFGDERWVPLDHPESNFAMAKESLLDRVPAFAGVYPMYSDKRDREDAAAQYGQLLKTPVDVLLLGMGPDAHIASIFPGSPALLHKEATALAVNGPKAPPERITITPAVISHARRTFMLVTGEDKAAALHVVLTQPRHTETRPAQLVRDATWLVDAGAASNLGLPDTGVTQ